MILTDYYFLFIKKTKIHKNVDSATCGMFKTVSAGSGDSSVVRAPDSWSKSRGFESLLERRENFLLQGQLSVLTHFSIRSTPVLPHWVARKRCRSFCQKRRWQVTAKHAYTLHMWLCMKWHGAWLYGVHRTRRDSSSFLWHQPCQRCKYTTSVDIQKTRYKKAIHSCRITCERSESARERRIAINNNNK